MDPNLTQSYREVSNTGPVIAGLRSTPRTGVFTAKMYSSHRHKLEFDVGDNPAGTVVYMGVQALHVQPQSVREAMKWICHYPGCTGKHWPTKADALEQHGDEQAIHRRGESHCLLGVSKLPPDVVEIVNITCKKDTHVMITVNRRIDLTLGDMVVISDVLTSEVIETIKVKNEKGVDVERAVRAQHPCNGTWLAIPQNAKMFAIECDGGRAAMFKDPHATKKPTALLHPERPILLSDEE